jgi:hypothetical protein
VIDAFRIVDQDEIPAHGARLESVLSLKTLIPIHKLTAISLQARSATLSGADDRVERVKLR